MNAEEFKELRTSKGLTQSDVAGLLGITTKQVSNIERGVSEIKKMYIEKISSQDQKIGYMEKIKNELESMSERELEYFYCIIRAKKLEKEL